jgi:16S rRNA (adenine(1408)-N(1))-methyltransferase
VDLARHRRAILDLGTGDGAAVLRLARRQPETLVIGVDADAATMREASDRADRKLARGGLPNVLFLTGTLRELTALGLTSATIDEVRVTLPWGSLLRAAVHAEQPFLADVRTLLAADGILRLLLSVTPRDAVAGIPSLDEGRVATLVERYGAAGLPISVARPATSADVRELGSTWAKRLGVPWRREAWLLETASVSGWETQRHGGTEPDPAASDRHPTVPARRPFGPPPDRPRSPQETS